jgi:tetratricopeptide (TPR) repeat protein
VKKLVVFILLILPFSFIPAHPVKSSNKQTDFDSTIYNGIKQIYSIDFTGAEKTFKGLIANYPDKPQGRFFLAMIDWWKILIDPDNESYDDIFLQKLEDVIYHCDGILDKDSKNVDALFFKGGSIGFRGRLRAYRESWIKAADDGRLALPIVEHAYKIDPKNIDVQLGFGIYDYYASVIPDQFPIVKPLMIFFPSGDKKKGIDELTNVALHGKYAKYESRYFLMTLYFSYDNNPFKADDWARMLTSDFPNNPVFERWQGRIAAKKGDYFSADRIFKDVLDKADRNFPGYNTINTKREASYYIGYQYRLANKIDSAKAFFETCLKNSLKLDKKEVSGFQINAYLYLGMIADEQGKRNEAVTYYKKLLDIREFNNSHSLAEGFLKTPYHR